MTCKRDIFRNNIFLGSIGLVWENQYRLSSSYCSPRSFIRFSIAQVMVSIFLAYTTIRSVKSNNIRVCGKLRWHLPTNCKNDTIIEDYYGHEKPSNERETAASNRCGTQTHISFANCRFSNLNNNCFTATFISWSRCSLSHTCLKLGHLFQPFGRLPWPDDKRAEGQVDLFWNIHHAWISKHRLQREIIPQFTKSITKITKTF